MRRLGKTSDLVILASSAFLVITMFLVVGVLKSGNPFIFRPRAANFEREVVGEGKTAHIEFSVNFREHQNAQADKGFAQIKTLSEDDEVKSAMLQADSILWTERTAFVTGKMNVVYRSSPSEKINFKLLLVDQDDLNPDPNPYYDVFGLLICDLDGCQQAWYPWTVEEGDIDIR